MSDSSIAVTGLEVAKIKTRKHRTLFTIEAILLILAGIVALVYPLMSTAALALVIGWVFIFGGLFRGIGLVAAGQAPQFRLQLVTAVLGIALGVICIRNPGVAVGTLALLMALNLLVAGTTQISLSLAIRPLQNSGWILAAGVLTLLLGLFLMFNPGMALATIGVFLGIQLSSEGMSIFMLMRE